MKTSRITILTFALLVVVASAFAATTKAPAAHGKSVHGTVQKLDDAAKTFNVRAAIKSYGLTWNDATKVTGGALKDGETVTVSYMVHDGKNVATSIMIVPPKKG